MSADELGQLLDILAATPANIQRLIDDVSDEQLRRRRSEGEFSIVENVCHLRDIEMEGYARRINQILTEDRPFLSDVDGGRLAIDRKYNEQDAHQALDAFSRARAENTAVLTKLELEQLSREGTLEGAGNIKLEGLLFMMRDHDGSHLRDIEQIRQQLG